MLYNLYMYGKQANKNNRGKTSWCLTLSKQLLVHVHQVMGIELLGKDIHQWINTELSLQIVEWDMSNAHVTGIYCLLYEDIYKDHQINKRKQTWECTGNEHGYNSSTTLTPPKKD